MGLFDGMGGGAAPSIGGMGGAGGGMPGGGASAFTSPGLPPQVLALLMAMQQRQGAPAMPGGPPPGPQMPTVNAAPSGTPPGAFPAAGVPGQNQQGGLMQMLMQNPQLMAMLRGLGGGGLGGMMGNPANLTPGT